MKHNVLCISSQFRTMQASSSFNRSFVKHMLLGLKLGGVYSKSMSFQERRRAIKLSADAAMANARGKTSWTQALVKNLSKREKGKALGKSILGNKCERFTRTCNQHSLKILRSKKILRRSFRACSRRKVGLLSSFIARRAMNKRMQLLKRLIPGGESLDGLSLLGETLDYAVYLQAQVNIMQHIEELSKYQISNFMKT